MGIYSEKSVANFKKGYNCAQAVLLSFATIAGLKDEEALRLASSFGGGMGRLREVCGAVSAMFMLAGILRGYTEPANDEIKAKHYALIQDLALKFKSKYNTIICRELLGLDVGPDSPVPSKRTFEYYAERPCENFIRTAAEIVESELLKERGKDFEIEINGNKD